MTSAAAKIVIVGLGPGDPDARTVGAQRALERADRIILRTCIHPGLDDILADPRVTDCDDLYEVADDFDSLYRQIADRVVSTAGQGMTVVFAVPGHPRFGERSVPLVEVAARKAGIIVSVLDAVSFVDSTANALYIDPLSDGLQMADALQIASTLDAEPFAAGSLGIDPARPLLIGQVYNTELAVSVKLALARLYPEDHAITIVYSSGISGKQDQRTVPLHALDRHPADHLTSVWVFPLAPLEAYRSPETLTRIVALLRRPDGCPWDRKQNHASLREPVLEEVYEVVDAIDSRNATDLSEELGDLLLLIAMHAQIAEEHGDFRIEDVYEGISRKLIRRHPHVFGAAEAQTPDAVVATWEGVKAAERDAKGDPPQGENPLDRLPRSMPITRKIIETLAPRTVLCEPDGPAAGRDALSAISALIETGIDPERALEAALVEWVRQELNGSEPRAAMDAEFRPGGTRA